MNHWVASEFEIVIEVLGFLRLRHHHVDAGRNVADRLIDRKGGGDVSVERRRPDRKLALPDRDAARVPQLIDFVPAEASLKIAAVGILTADRFGEIAIANAEDFYGDGPGVGGDNGNAPLAGSRQNVCRRGKMHCRFAVAHIDGKIRRFR